jgi:type IV secretion system protein VirB10
MLQAGVVIQATTLNEVNSDLPGDIVAQIAEDVMDTPTGQHVLIPATAKLYGRYSDDIEYGQSRALIAWNRILFPDGSSQNIGSMSGTDAGGAAGVEADVDRHEWKMAGAIGLSVFTSIVGQAGALWGDSGGQTTIVGVGAQGAGQEAQSIAREIANRELNRRNTLRIPQGYTVAVMLSRDVALPPWKGGQR